MLRDVNEGEARPMAQESHAPQETSRLSHSKRIGMLQLSSKFCTYAVAREGAHIRADGPRAARRVWTGTRFGGEQRVRGSTLRPPKAFH